MNGHINQKMRQKTLANDKIKIKRTIEYTGPNKRDYFLADLFKKIQPTDFTAAAVKSLKGQ